MSSLISDGPDPSEVEPAAERPRWLTPDDDDQPVRTPLSRRRIVLTALNLVEDEGLAALTMRRVASKLHVTPMSLYNHVSDKAELIDLMVDFILADVVAEPLDGGNWAAQLRTLSRRTYKTWSAHPGFARVYTDGVTVGPNGLANIERLIGVLRRAGFSDEDAARTFFLLYQYVISSLLVAAAKPLSLRDRGNRSDGSKDDRINRYLSALPADDIPNVVAVAGHLSGNDFEFGLEILLDGLEARLAGSRRRPTRTATGRSQPQGGRPKKTR